MRPKGKLLSSLGCRFGIYTHENIYNVLPNIFGECLLGPWASQLRHKPLEMHRANRDDIASPNFALNVQLIPSQNGSLASLIAHNSRGKMMVGFDCCVFLNAIWCDLLTPSLHVHNSFFNFFLLIVLRTIRDGNRQDIRTRQLSGSTSHTNNRFEDHNVGVMMGILWVH